MPDFLGPHVFADLLALLEADGRRRPTRRARVRRTRATGRSNYGEVYRATQRLAEKHDGEELFRLGQAAGLPWGVIRAPEEVARRPRTSQPRGHFVEIDGVTHAARRSSPAASPFTFRSGPPSKP